MIHPKDFARFSFCDQCSRPVDKIETDHPNGVTKGPWTLTAHCHTTRYSYRIEEYAVSALLTSETKPYPIMFFTDLIPCRPASRTEIRYFEVEGLLDYKAELAIIEAGKCAVGFDISNMGYVCAGCGSVYATKKEADRRCPSKGFMLSEFDKPKELT